MKGHYCAWFDGSVRNSGSFISYYITAPGPQSKVVLEVAKKVSPYRRNINEIECLALYELVDYVFHNGIEKIKIFGDSRNIIDAVKSPKSKFMEARAIRALLKTIPEVELQWTPRKNNGRADKLCRLKSQSENNATRELCSVQA